jgi:predicted esterase
LVGYEQGAAFAGNVTIAHPNRFAGVALVNGVPRDYAAGSSPWTVKQESVLLSLKICLMEPYMMKAAPHGHF